MQHRNNLLHLYTISVLHRKCEVTLLIITCSLHLQTSVEPGPSSSNSQITLKYALKCRIWKELTEDLYPIGDEKA